ncbi:MAG: hypothetical protein KDA67_04520 [Rhodobacteraceae bacterium]|nr:hypothetical protein [Paracoccaceae bacterium]
MKSADLESAGQIKAIVAGNSPIPAVCPPVMMLTDTGLPTSNQMVVKHSIRQRCGTIIDGIDIQDANSRLEVPVPKVNTLMKTCANRQRLTRDIPAFADQIGGKVMVFSSVEPADIQGLRRIGPNSKTITIVEAVRIAADNWYDTFFKASTNNPAVQQEASQ